jgi:hypothetical protein
MSTWSFYDQTTGVIVDLIFTMTDDPSAPGQTPAALTANTPANCVPLEGRYDWRTQRVDIASRSVVERPASSIVIAQAGGVVTLSGVALDTVVTVTGDASESVTQDSTDGILQLTFSATGVYLLSATQFPEQEFNATITV